MSEKAFKPYNCSPKDYPMNFTYILTIFSLLIAASTSRASQALTLPKTTDTFVPRSQALSKLLYETLDTMPLELIKIIVDYEPHFLRGEVEQKLHLAQTVSCLMTLPNTNLLVSGDNDGRICIWNLPTGICEKKIPAHGGSIKSLVLVTPHRLASAAWDNKIKIWYTPRWECLLSVEKKLADSSPLCSPAYPTIFYQDHKGNAMLWDIKTGHRVSIERAIESQIPLRTLIRLPNNKVASAGNDHIQIWDCTKKSCIKTMVHPEHKMVGALAFIPPHFLACGYLEIKALEITIWDIDAGIPIQTLQGHTSYVICLTLLVDGRLASGSHDGTVKLWDITNIKHALCTATLTPPQTPPNSQASVPMMLAQLSPAPSPTLVIEPLPTLPAITALCVLAQGNLAVGDSSGKITIYS